MDYSTYNVEDFLTDESFINYCYDLNETDRQHWETTIYKRPLLKNKIAEARALCLLMGVKVSKAEKTEALEKLKASIAGEKLKKSSAKASNVRKLWSPRMAIAASLILFIVAYGIYKHSAPVSGAALYSQITTTNYHLVAQTPWGKRKTVTLPDGSTVMLSGASSLKIAEDYNSANRHVLLTGEAFFEVKKDKTRPFVVLTSKTATTALGTSFKVSNYPQLTTAGVMLATGKVKVESTQEKSAVADQILLPGQQVTLTTGAGKFVRSTFDRAALRDWVNSKLVFTNATFTQIAAKITNTYGVHIITDSKLADKIRFTGQFEDKSLNDVLDAIGFVNDFKYAQSGDTIKIVLN